jgi:transcription-repair coupling factor (superfamily II helicase)
MSGPAIDVLLQALGEGSPVLATGLHLPTTTYLAARCARKLKGAIVVIVPTEGDARQVASDLRPYLDTPGEESKVLQVPAHELSPYAEMSGDRRALRERMAALYRLANLPEKATTVAVVSGRSLMQRVIPKAAFLSLCDKIEVHKEIDRDLLSESLVAAGYSRSTIVEESGQFAVRGGVVDLHPPYYRFPIRIELFGDEVESIRHFDAETQRTLRSLDALIIHPVRETIATSGAEVRNRILEAADTSSHPSKATRLLIDNINSGIEFIGIDGLAPAFHKELVELRSYLPEGGSTTYLVHEPGLVLQRTQDEYEDAQRRYEDQLESHRIAFAPDEHYLHPEAIEEQLSHAPRRIEAQSLRIEGENLRYTKAIHLEAEDNIALRGQLERRRKVGAGDPVQPLLDVLASSSGQGYRVLVACDSAARLGRLRALLEEHGVGARIDESKSLALDAAESGGAPLLTRAKLSAGFRLQSEALLVLTCDDIFGEKRRSTRRQRRAAERARQALKGGVTDFSQLKVGDHLVHTIHGVGLYNGLSKLPIQGVPIDFLHIEYQGGNLYLPVVRIGEVQRYVGAEGLNPKLDKLGGTSFAKTKSKVSKKVHALAEALLQLYAQRAALPGHAYPPPDSIYHEFESSFEFEETPDQQKAIDEICQDMSEPRPMDRLVCGDVGYGKTEVALRAILRAVFGGKQVAFLAPTTVLVEQHFQTMRKRFEGWPIRIARLSRFQKKKEQLETVQELASGQLDAVVGTHRLLSADVRFKDLGLVVIDEEQRFGVTHKERFKKMRASVEVLTLSATPIPRTLHLAMTGLRDLSIIATPPADRRAIRTFVARTEDGVLREAIRKELDRRGQVFFVSPRIHSPVGGGERSLEEWAAHLGELVPDAKIALAHGQMAPDKLERVMLAFVEGKYDILVSTTIVEAGLDIPRANTMFVDRADRFGLSQLYQLRGRIGRSRERAYCYLLVPAPEKLNDDARKRLETLQRYSELGAGFSIASQDLEIRGAGELLGAKQSGSIAAIGFDAYTQMLEEAVAELRGTPIQHERDPELNVDLAGYIPDEYVPETGQRLALYKRLASAADEAEVREILEEIVDCYGPIPEEVGVLGELMVIKSQARKLRALSLELNPVRLVLALGDDTPLEPSKIMELIQKPHSQYRLTPDMRLVRQFSKAEVVRPVETAKASLMELLACATSMATGV